MAVKRLTAGESQSIESLACVARALHDSDVESMDRTLENQSFSRWLSANPIPNLRLLRLIPIRFEVGAYDRNCGIGCLRNDLCGKWNQL